MPEDPTHEEQPNAEPGRHDTTAHTSAGQAGQEPTVAAAAQPTGVNPADVTPAIRSASTTAERHDATDATDATAASVVVTAMSAAGVEAHGKLQQGALDGAQGLGTAPAGSPRTGAREGIASVGLKVPAGTARQPGLTEQAFIVTTTPETADTGVVGSGPIAGAAITVVAPGGVDHGATAPLVSEPVFVAPSATAVAAGRRVPECENASISSPPIGHLEATTSAGPGTQAATAFIHPSLPPVRTAAQPQEGGAVAGLMPSVAPMEDGTPGSGTSGDTQPPSKSSEGFTQSGTPMDVETPGTGQPSMDLPATWEYQEQVLQKAAEIMEARELLKRGTIPPAQEPKRLKAHWDYLLEEMEWLAKEVAKERVWKVKQCKRFAKAVGKSKLNVESRGEVKEKEHEVAMRKIAAGYSKQVMEFWKKAERLVNYKRFLMVEQRKQAEMEKHLSFLVGQTERYSRVLAENLRKDEEDEEQVQAGKKILPIEATPEKSMPLSLHVEDVTPSESKGNKRPAKRGHADETAGTSRGGAKRRKTRGKKRRGDAYAALQLEGDAAAEDEDDFHADVDQDDDDEATLSAEEDLANQEGGADHKRELNELDEDAQLSVEELLAKYYGGNPPADSPPASPQRDEGGEDADESGESDTSESVEEEEENAADEGGEEEAEGEDGVEEGVEAGENDGDTEGEKTSKHRGRMKGGPQETATAEDDGDDREEDEAFSADVDEDDDDEATMEAEEQLAASEAAGKGEKVDELDDLQADLDAPLHEVLARYQQGADVVSEEEEDVHINSTGSAGESEGGDDGDSVDDDEDEQDEEETHADDGGGSGAAVHGTALLVKEDDDGNAQGGTTAGVEGDIGRGETVADTDGDDDRAREHEGVTAEQPTAIKEPTQADKDVGTSSAGPVPPTVEEPVNNGGHPSHHEVVVDDVDMTEVAGTATAAVEGARPESGPKSAPEPATESHPSHQPDGKLHSEPESAAEPHAGSGPTLKPCTDEPDSTTKVTAELQSAETVAETAATPEQPAALQLPTEPAQKPAAQPTTAEGEPVPSPPHDSPKPAAKLPAEAEPALKLLTEEAPAPRQTSEPVLAPGGELSADTAAGPLPEPGQVEAAGAGVGAKLEGSEAGPSHVADDESDEERMDMSKEWSDGEQEEGSADFVAASDDDQEDDEATLEEEEELAAREGGTSARNEEDALKAEADVPLEELLARYYGQGGQQEGEGDSADEDTVMPEAGRPAEATLDERKGKASGGKKRQNDGQAKREKDGGKKIERKIKAERGEDDGGKGEGGEREDETGGVEAAENGPGGGKVIGSQEMREKDAKESLGMKMDDALLGGGKEAVKAGTVTPGHEEEDGGFGAKTGGEEGEAWEEASRKASEAQPTGYTLATSQVKTVVPFLLKANLREYQHIGLDWLVALYKKKLNGILADEMGLGKTIQAISLLAWLACEEGSWGPHLIVVPTSVMLNWEMEFKKFCPAFKLLTYFGNTKERKAKRQGWSKPNAFHICITSYTLVLQDAKMFRRKKWKYLILDEAHMIKNWKSQRWQTLLKFNSKRRLLITGTPLQNDLMELWSLMHFLMPHVFASHAQFKDWFCNPLTQAVEGQGDVNKQLVDRLHSVLRPFLLRRLKLDVEKQMPAKHEHVVYCRLSKRQRTLYEDYMSSTETQGTLASGNYMGIISVLMQLRKVCNHPDLFEGRPIVSPYDMPPLHLYVPSCILTATQPDMREHIDVAAHGLIPAALPPLASWDSHFIASRATSSDSMLDLGVNLPVELLAKSTHPLVAAAAELRLQATMGEVFGAGSPRLLGGSSGLGSVCTQPPPSSELAEASMRFLGAMLTQHLAAWHSWRQQQVSFMAAINAVRCGVRPLWSRDLVEMLAKICVGPLPSCPAMLWSNPYRLRDCPSILLELSCTYEERAESVKTLLEEFVFAIPKARAPIAVCWCSHPDWSTVHVAAQRSAALDAEWYARNGSLRTARVRQSMFFPDRKLIQFDCGKLQELALLLRKLHRGGHRALIFTQMARMLDILEAFLNIHGYTYMRLDGSTKPEQRQILMQRFNTDTKYFVFILSTRSGGVGINLTGADTVIFYDSDWNPAMDAQAQDRCHRIGQTREVHIYRLVCQKTIEENILKKSDQKRQLDWLAIQSGGFTTDVLNKINPKDLMAGAAMSGGPSADDIQAAMRTVEDEADAVAAKVAEREQAEEMEEFTQEPVGGVADGDAEEGGRDDEDVAVASGGEGQGAIEPRLGADWPGLSTPGDAAGVLGRGESVAAEAASMGGVVGIESKIQQLEAALRPVEKYAVRIVEELNPVDIDAAVNKAVEALNPLDFSLEELEKRKQLQEEEVDDDEELAVVVDWDKQAGQEAYERYAEMVKQQMKELEEQEALRALMGPQSVSKKPKGSRGRGRGQPPQLKLETEDSSSVEDFTEVATDGDETGPASGTTEADDSAVSSPNIRYTPGRRERDPMKRGRRAAAVLLAKAPVFFPASPSAPSSPSASSAGHLFNSDALQTALAQLKELHDSEGDSGPEMPVAKRRRLREQKREMRVKNEQGEEEDSTISIAGSWQPAEQLWHPWPSAWDAALTEAVLQLLQLPGSCPPPPKLWMQVPELVAERVAVTAEEWVTLTPGNCQLRYLALLRAWMAHTSTESMPEPSPSQQLDSLRQRLAHLSSAINVKSRHQASEQCGQEPNASGVEDGVLQHVYEELSRMQATGGVTVKQEGDTHPLMTSNHTQQPAGTTHLLTQLTVRTATRLATAVHQTSQPSTSPSHSNSSKGRQTNATYHEDTAEDTDTEREDDHFSGPSSLDQHTSERQRSTGSSVHGNALARPAAGQQFVSLNQWQHLQTSAHQSHAHSAAPPSGAQSKGHDTFHNGLSPPGISSTGATITAQPGWMASGAQQRELSLTPSRAGSGSYPTQPPRTTPERPSGQQSLGRAAGKSGTQPSRSGAGGRPVQQSRAVSGSHAGQHTHHALGSHPAQHPHHVLGSQPPQPTYSASDRHPGQVSGAQSQPPFHMQSNGSQSADARYNSAQVAPMSSQLRLGSAPSTHQAAAQTAQPQPSPSQLYLVGERQPAPSQGATPTQNHPTPAGTGQPHTPHRGATPASQPTQQTHHPSQIQQTHRPSQSQQIQRPSQIQQTQRPSQSQQTHRPSQSQQTQRPSPNHLQTVWHHGRPQPSTTDRTSVAAPTYLSPSQQQQLNATGLYLLPSNQAGSQQHPTNLIQLPQGAVVYQPAAPVANQPPALQILSGNLLTTASDTPPVPTGYAPDTAYIPVLLTAANGTQTHAYASVPTTPHSASWQQSPSSTSEGQTHTAARFQATSTGLPTSLLLNATSSRQPHGTELSQAQLQALQQAALRQATTEQDQRRGNVVTSVMQVAQGGAQNPHMRPQVISWQQHPLLAASMQQGQPPAAAAGNPGGEQSAALGLGGQGFQQQGSQQRQGGNIGMNLSLGPGRAWTRGPNEQPQ